MTHLTIKGPLGSGRFGPRRWAVAGAAAAALLSALALTACGGTSTSNADSSATTGTYVTAYDVSQYKPGTPQRTVTEWWKAVQFGNTTLAHRYYAPRRGPKLNVLQGELAAASNQFTGIPTFNSAEVHGNKATLYLFAARPGSSAPPRAVSVNLIKKSGHWGLADDQLLEQVVERVKTAEKQRNG